MIEIKKYNEEEFKNKQNIIFNKLGLNRNLGFENLKIVKNKLNLTLSHGMSSEHEVLLSSISLNNLNIKEILEIGTFDGYNAVLLSNLFKNSKVDTIDLPDNADVFLNTYNRKNNYKNFIAERNNKILNYKNIKFKELNSLKLINSQKKYDLIWIDGAHGYPFVCIDIINSLNLINFNGYILCDDVFTNLNYQNSDKMYNSIASYETLSELQKENIIEFNLIFKRLEAKYNSVKEDRKFVAIIQKK